MANKEHERKTFQWGDQEYLLDDLLKLHSQQEQNFYRFAADEGGYDGNALAGLRKAIISRINSAKAGVQFDADGALATDTADNVHIQTQKKGVFKKEKYVDQDNTEWAKYYISQLVSKLEPYNKKDPNEWDSSKFGLGAFIQGNGYAAQDIFEQLDKRNEDADDDSPRPNVERRQLLKDMLTKFKTHLGKHSYDFTADDNDLNDNFIEHLDTLIAEIDTIDNVKLAASLRFLGLPDEYVTAFTSNSWDLSKDASALKAERDAKKKAKKDAEIAQEFEDYLRGQLADHTAVNGNKKGKTTFYNGVLAGHDIPSVLIPAMKEKNVTDPNTIKYLFRNSPYQDWTQNQNQSYVAQIYFPFMYSAGNLKPIGSGQYADWLYDPTMKDTNTNSVLAVNPDTGDFESIYLGLIPSELETIRRNFMIKNGYLDEVEEMLGTTSSYKQGGVVMYQTGGDFDWNIYVKRELDNQNKTKAAMAGRSPEMQKARDRVVSNGKNPLTSEESNFWQENAGFTTAEKVRLGSIAVDIASVFLTPVAGTIAGIGSSAANLYADIKDDGFQTSDLWNFAKNVGLDLVGAIPIFGDTVGTGAKIVKSVSSLAPKALAALGMMQGVANLGGMMESWSKLLSDDANTKLTVQDWRNIQQSISLLMGSTRAIENKIAKTRLQNQAKVDDVVGINVTNKEGKTQQLLVDGDVAKRVREARGSKTQVTQVLNEAEGLKGKVGKISDGAEFEVNVVGTKFQLPYGKVTKDNGDTSTTWRGFMTDGRADVRAVYDFSRPQAGSESYRRVADRLNNTTEQIDFTNRTVSNLTDDVLKQAKAVEASVAKRNNRLQELQTQADAQQKQLADIDQATAKITVQQQAAQKKVSAAEKKVVKSQAVVNARKKAYDDARKRIKTSANPEDQKQYAASIQEKLKQERKILNADKRALKKAQQQAADYDAKLKDLVDRNTVQASLNKIQRAKKMVQYDPNNPKSHTHAYQKLQETINRYKKQHTTGRPGQMNWDINEIFKQAGVTGDMFKQGGSINKAKLDKFLNYVTR